MTPLILIAGPCVVESYDTCAQVAAELVKLQVRHGDKLHCIFKSSIDKANRSSIDSYRGLGLREGFDIMRKIAGDFDLPITTDFHTCEQVKDFGRYFDVIQIPALLSRQTDLISSAAMVGSIVNVKKGQFAAPGDMAGIRSKFNAMRDGSTKQFDTMRGGAELWITERGSCFGYGRMIVDLTGIAIMRPYADKVIVDCTHSNNGRRSDGMTLARCAVAAGADGIFLEVHPDPDSAKCDGPNSLELQELGRLIDQVIAIDTELSAAPG